MGRWLTDGFTCDGRRLIWRRQPRTVDGLSGVVKDVLPSRRVLEHVALDAVGERHAADGAVLVRHCCGLAEIFASFRSEISSINRPGAAPLRPTLLALSAASRSPTKSPGRPGVQPVAPIRRAVSRGHCRRPPVAMRMAQDGGSQRGQQAALPLMALRRRSSRGAARASSAAFPGNACSFAGSGVSTPACRHRDKFSGRLRAVQVHGRWPGVSLAHEDLLRRDIDLGQHGQG
jgi:hypothetical protein